MLQLPFRSGLLPLVHEVEVGPVSFHEAGGARSSNRGLAIPKVFVGHRGRNPLEDTVWSSDKMATDSKCSGLPVRILNAENGQAGRRILALPNVVARQGRRPASRQPTQKLDHGKHPGTGKTSRVAGGDRPGSASGHVFPALVLYVWKCPGPGYGDL